MPLCLPISPPVCNPTTALWASTGFEPGVGSVDGEVSDRRFATRYAREISVVVDREALQQLVRLFPVPVRLSPIAHIPGL